MSHLEPSLSKEEVAQLLAAHPEGNCVPISLVLSSETLTPIGAYLRLTDGAAGKPSFLFESAVRGESSGRWSYVGADPSKIIRTTDADPLVVLEQELGPYRVIETDSRREPSFTGGAIGYISYDCVKYFEPKTAPKGPIGPGVDIPEAVFLVCDVIVAFDHVYSTVQVVGSVFVPGLTDAGDASAGIDASAIAASYDAVLAKMLRVAELLEQNTALPEPLQPRISLPTPEAVSNVGEVGYKAFVTSLKKDIAQGDIIQAVPSQRLRKETELHPFNAYRHLRRINPSPYLFYVDCGDGLRLVGASPECLCRVDHGRVENHAIAGTIRRGKNDAEDAVLADELAHSLKDRAEHVMLVDLARNDVNRVCVPESVNVDSLMQVEKFSHVMHLTSQVSGQLRPGLNRFDAFRSIFPAGTVSGAPKIRAIELVGALEKEKRGVYAGAVGRFNFESTSMDTCIAIRTIVFKDGCAYFQAGGGIVYDSDEQDEYIETINKLKANVRCVEGAEGEYEVQHRAPSEARFEQR